MSKRRRRSHRELSSQFSIRLFADQLASYEEKLAGSGVSITEYIRERLDGQDQVNEVLESVLERLSDIDQKLEQLSTKDKGGNDAVSVEMLLLLRSLLRNNSGKDTIKMVQADIKNMGLQPFDIDHGGRR